MLSCRTERLLLLLITALGFALRLHTLGRDGFWLDEAGQALAVLQPTWAGMVAIERTHAMAMPLDYVVARLFGVIHAGELVLRYPAALWGALSVPLLAALARRVADRPTAVLAAFFLAVSPVFVRYAQELRFYAALGALFLLVALLLVEAFRQPSCGNWLRYTAAATVAAYFHPYALLPALSAGVYWLLPVRVTGLNSTTRLRFVLASAAVALLFLPGYWLFGAHQEYTFELLQWGGTLASVTRQGLDWTSFAAGYRTPLALGVYTFSVVFAIAGAAVALRRWPRYPWLVSLLGGVLLSVIAIIVASRLKGYWYLPRQLLPLATITLLLCAFGYAKTISFLTVRVARPARRAAAVGLLALPMLLVGTAAGQSLAVYYALPKSLAREAALALTEAHERRDTILIIPGFDRQIYEFYLTRSNDFVGAGDHLRPVEWSELPAALPTTGEPTYLVIRGALSDEQRAALADWGFAAYWPAQQARDGVFEVFVRNSDTE